ncbi:MAG: recombinase family protein [Candidatus Woykebacteria bacterium]
MNIKAVAYYRVSSREQQEEGYSIEAQQKRVKEYAEKKGLEIVKEFAEIETAKVAGRKIFGEMIDFVFSTPEIQGIVCHKVDRLCRNLKDYVKVDDLGIKAYFVEEEFAENANGKLTFGLKIILAKHYIDNLSDEVKKGMREKVEQGGYPHKPPFGYTVDASVMPHKIVPDVVESVVIQKIFEYYATGSYSIMRLKEKLAEEGFGNKKNGHPIAKSDLGKILRNPFYYGWFNWNGELWSNKGTYLPVVSKELWDKVQGVLDEQNRPKVRKHNFTYTMLMKCGECGNSITAEKKVKRYTGTNRDVAYTYYHCTRPYHSEVKCRQKPINEADLEIELGKVVDDVNLDNKAVEAIKFILKQSHTDEEEFHTNSIKALNSQKEEIQFKLDRLLDSYLEGTISKEVYEVKNRQLTEDKESTLTQLDKHEAGNKDYFEQVENFIDLCHIAPQIYTQSSNTQLKRELLKFLVSDLVLKDKKVSPVYQFPFSALVKHRKNENWSG